MTNEKFEDLMFRAGFLPDNETGRFEGNTIFGTTHDTALRNLVALVALQLTFSFNKGTR